METSAVIVTEQQRAKPEPRIGLVQVLAGLDVGEASVSGYHVSLSTGSHWRGM
jgi:hypothetical protein